MAGSPPSRKPRLDAAPSDLLSSLPLEVLNNILSRLHIRDVGRTSVLSRAWRGRWESLPTVILVGIPGIHAADVDAILLRRSAPIRTFGLGTRGASWFTDTHLDNWLIYLSRNGVQVLVLSFPQLNFRLHSSLFSCRELTSLTLKYCRLPPAPPGFAGFPNLKDLDFYNVVIPEHGGRQLADLIASSPLIEIVKLMKVELTGDHPDDDWVIQGPNIRELTIVCDGPSGGRTGDLPRLEEGTLFGPNYAKFLMGMSRVTKLEYWCIYFQPTEVDVLDRLPFLFKNLKSLVVAVNFTKISEILAMFCLFRSAPMLEELDVWGFSDGTQEIDADEDFLNAQWADGMFSKLRIVRMKYIACLCNEFEFMEFILSKARVLQVLSIKLVSDAVCSNEEAVTSIIQYPRASSDAQVIFLGRESTNTGSVITPTKSAEVEESQSTDSEHDSKSDNTDADNAEVEEADATDSGPSSISASTENAEVEESETTDSRQGSISMSRENAEVKDVQATHYRDAVDNTSTEHSLNNSILPFPVLISHLDTPRLGDTPDDHAIKGATSAHPDSPENRCVNIAANTDCQEDHVVNGASNAPANSSEEHLN